MQQSLYFARVHREGPSGPFGRKFRVVRCTAVGVGDVDGDRFGAVDGPKGVGPSWTAIR